MAGVQKDSCMWPDGHLLGYWHGPSSSSHPAAYSDCRPTAGTA